MKLKKKTIIIGLIIIIAITASIIVGINILNDKTRLTVDEKKWLNENKSNVISLSVINDLNIFGSNGEGVFYDFMNSLKEEHDIDINPVTFNSDSNIDGLSLGISTTKDKFTSFYDDEFVLVSKSEQTILDYNKIYGMKIGIEKKYKDYLNKYFENRNIEYAEYETKDELLKTINEDEELKYIVVPKVIYLDSILENNYHIVYHFSDINIYYGLKEDDSALSSIVAKYFSSWQKKDFYESLNKYESQVVLKSLDISSEDLDKIKANTYAYGFVTNEPYEIISGGNFGGINATCLKKFTDLYGIKIDYIKYRKLDSLKEAIEDKKVDIYYDYYNLSTNYTAIDTMLPVEYVVLVAHDDSTVINSMNSLRGKTVYAQANTKLDNYMSAIKTIKTKTYNTDKEFKKAVKNKNIIIVDSNKYESYKNNILSDYSIRYTGVIDDTYKLKTNVDDTFAKLLSKYFEIQDNNQTKYSGLNNYYKTKKSGTLFGTLAKYILVLFIIFIIIILITYKKTKKIKVAKKIKKEDKMKFIDQLTSLKNRNYLTENLENWNNNTIYPQAVIVLDLNNLQSINDTLGYEQGDIQIQAVANILIKTQLDNSDVIRTDGNEFLIYLVGYEVKQVTSYIHKLNKEFKKLPFDDYGVAVGYSMITDDVKSVEDATNEAVEQVKLQKEGSKNE